MTLAVAGLATLLAPRPAVGQYPYTDRPSEMSIGRASDESGRRSGSFFNGSYVGTDRPLLFGGDQDRYLTVRSPYPPVFFTSLYYPGIYGSYAYGVVASDSRKVRAVFRRAESPFFDGIVTTVPARTVEEVPDRTRTELRSRAEVARTVEEVPDRARTELRSRAEVASPARISVSLPAEATLSFQGSAMKEVGAVREFESPPLTPGRAYDYEVRATWKAKDGQDVVRTRHLTVRAGDRLEVDLNRELLPVPSEPATEQRSLRTQPQRLRDVPPAPRP